MDKKQQIEEIGQIICGRCEDGICLIDKSLCNGLCEELKAEALYNAGYRKIDKDGYGWHISDLKIYDKPKELSEFRKSGFITEEEWLFNLYPNNHCHYDAWAKKFGITRPPQSWQYVDEI